MSWITIKNTCIDFERVKHFSAQCADGLFLIIVDMENDSFLTFPFDSKDEMQEEFENITDVL